MKPLYAAPVAQEPVDFEHCRAIKEGERNAAEDEFFKARPKLNDTPYRVLFCAGFDRGWNAAPVAASVSQEPVAWRDPSNVDPAQSVTFDKARAEQWPHIYSQPLYVAPVAAQSQPSGISGELRATQLSAQDMGDTAYRALRELVRLKDIKDRMDRSQTVTSFEIDDYQRNKPKAWEAARRAVARQPDSAGRIVASAYRLVEDAKNSGMLVRIDLVPRKPLAMGNLEMIVDVRPARAKETT